MFYLIQVLLRVVGFEGDDMADVDPSPLERAIQQAEFLFRRCSESFLVRSAISSEAALDFPEYDVHSVLAQYFPKRREPSSYPRIPIRPSPPISFAISDHPNFWADTSRVVEASLIALARTKSRAVVAIDVDGKVLTVDPQVVDSIVVEMVESPSSLAKGADARKGSRTPRSPRPRGKRHSRVLAEGVMGGRKSVSPQYFS